MLFSITQHLSKHIEKRRLGNDIANSLNANEFVNVTGNYHKEKENGKLRKNQVKYTEKQNNGAKLDQVHEDLTSIQQVHINHVTTNSQFAKDDLDVKGQEEALQLELDAVERLASLSAPGELLY